MSALLLATKVQIPPARTNLVVRPRLFARLDEGLGSPLMLVSAPPGFGKTTIISEWLRRRSGHLLKPADGDLAQTAVPRIRAAWLALSEEENESTRFLT
jgi:LuxR family transcriptional regulator, maltose regulon positive regulatory protein